MNLKLLSLCAVFFMNSALARMEKFSDEDVLAQVSSKLSSIESHLENQRVFLSKTVFVWNELDQFQKDLMFAVAHDPHSQPSLDIPEELRPTYLTLKLKDSWAKLEESVVEIEFLTKTEEWLTLKMDMEQFFKQRDDFLYQSARMMIKSGELTRKLYKLKELGRKFHKNVHGKNHYHVRVMDPFVEKLANEIKTLNGSLRQLKEFRRPVPVVKKTIFQKKHLIELTFLSISALGLGVLFGMMMVSLSKRFRKKRKHVLDEKNEATFDFRGWQKEFDSLLKKFRSLEDKLIEDHLNLRPVGNDLRVAREKLNQADTQQDFYSSLEMLNQSAPRVEEYFANANVKKNTEVSRKMVESISQLCDAIEAGQIIDVASEQKRIIRIKKTDNYSYSKVA